MENRLVKNLFLAIPLFLTIVLLMFLPLMTIYALIIHFTGQHYGNFFYLILFLFLLCLIDMGVGTFIDSFLHAVTDIYKDIFVNKLIASTITFVGTYIVIIGLDSFLTVIDLSMTVTILIAFIHFASSLLFDKFDKGEDNVDESDNELYQIDLVVKSEIESLLKTEMHWVDCVKLIKEKYPDIPKERIISVTRKLHMENKNSSF